ncbi:MAG TPA: hypothetical protein VJT75_12115 [Thermoleophilaceae bacterium]|nr:hypothetical protein [Thermoleophilaceae bacterium]
MRSVVIPGVVALWGIAIVVNHFAAKSHGSGAYASGQSAAMLFGIVMAVLGTVYLVRGLRERR